MRPLITDNQLRLQQLIQHNLSKMFLQLKSISMGETFDKKSNSK